VTPASSRASSRAAAVGLAAALLAIVGFGLVRPYAVAVSDAAAQLEAQGRIAAGFRVLAEAPTRGEAEPADARELAALTLPRASTAQATALLQQTLKSFAADARVEIEGVQVLARAETKAAARLIVRLRGRADMSSLARFLYAVETARPVLVVEGLRVQARTAREAAGRELDLQIDVAAFTAESET